MTRQWRLLVTPAGFGAWNMAVDEAVLEHASRGETPPTLRMYAWEPPCVSVGFAQPYADVDLSALEEHAWNIVRRPTGGRAILHTDELTYSVMAPADEPAVAGTLLESYNRLAKGLLHAIRALGLPADMKSGERSGGARSAGARANPVCFEVPSAYEITVSGKKLIGSAQARRREGVLQHGSLPLKGDLARITRVLRIGGNGARAQAVTRLLRRATTVEAIMGRTVPWQEAAEQVRCGFEAELNLAFTSLPLTKSEERRARELVRDKYGNPSWTERV